MFGGLHIKKALSSTLGDILDCSGWTNLLTEAAVSTSGTSDSYLKAAHITNTRKAHEVTAVALFILQKKAYDSFESALPKYLLSNGKRRWKVEAQCLNFGI